MPVILGILTICLLVSACSREPATPGFQFVEATIADIHSAIERGDARCVDIIAGYLARIDAYDKSTGLNSIIFTNPNALEKAGVPDVTAVRVHEAAGRFMTIAALIPIAVDERMQCTPDKLMGRCGDAVFTA